MSNNSTVFVVGHIDPGESDLDTAYRETLEESGFHQADIKVFEDSKKTLNYLVNNKPKIVHYWIAELINEHAKVKLSDEHQAFKWLELKEACELAGYKDMQDMLLEYDKFIKHKYQ